VVLKDIIRLHSFNGKIGMLRMKWSESGLGIIIRLDIR